MANIRINDLPATTSVLTDDVLPMDGLTTRKIKPADMVAAVRPIATQAQAESGTDNTTTMTPLAGAQQIAAKLPNTAAGRAILAAADAAAQRAALGLGGSAQLAVGTTAGTVAAGDDIRFAGVAGIVDQATAEAGTNNTGIMSPLRTKQQIDARVGTGAGTLAAGNDIRITGAAQKAQNLADLASASTARTNLGLGGSATLNVGTTVGTVAAGNDARFGIVADGSVTDIKVATQVDPADLIDGNKIRYIDPNGISMPLNVRQRNWMWITDNGQVTGNGTSDDTTGVQNAVDEAVNNGRVLLVPDNIQIRTTAPIDVQKRFVLQGGGVSEAISLMTTGTPVHNRGPGSWFYLDHSGIGFDIHQPPNPTGFRSAEQGHRIQGIGTRRNQPVPTGGAYTPGAFDFDFNVTEGAAQFNDLVMLNPTKGIRIQKGGFGRISLMNVRGQPLQTGVEFESVYDACRTYGIHFWPFWTFDVGVLAYQRANGAGILSKRNDNPLFVSTFTFAYAAGLRFASYAGDGGSYPAGSTNICKVIGADCDNGSVGLQVDADSDGAAIYVHGLSSTGAGVGLATADSSNITVNGTNTRLECHGLRLQNALGSGVRVNGTNNLMTIAGLDVSDINLGGAGFAGVSSDGSGNIVEITGAWRHVGANERSSATSGAVVRANLAQRQTAGTTDGSGDLTITHGLQVTPTWVQAAPLGGNGHAFAHTLNATTFKIRVSDSAGNVLASTPLAVQWGAYLG